MKRILCVAVTVALLAGISGCVKRVTLTNKFDQAEAQAALEPGNNTIKGSAVIRRNDGMAVTCAGVKVQLIPVTTYSTERMQAKYKSTESGYADAVLDVTTFTNEDPAYQTFGTRDSMCDAQGYFKFDEVKDGAFYVVTAILWEAGPGSRQGGALMRKVVVSGGKTVETMLSPHS